ncbi:MAG: penicillin-binding protein activator [Gallionella sp.]|nr:penicillin-binding protein activator [Gallionella sp.]
MQRVLLILSTIFALYACTPAQVHKPGTDIKAGTVRPAVAHAEIKKPAPVTAVIKKPASVTVTPEISNTPLSAEQDSTPHIALLLPLQSANFGTAAAAVQQGFMAAAHLNPQALPVRAYSNVDENSSITAVYRHAIANGARAVVGPLTRNGVTALAELQYFPVPTLGLNIPDSRPVHNLYFFGMAVEMEARQVAQLARRQGFLRAIVITSHGSLARRLQFAFEEQWIASGGTITREIEASDDATVFANIVAQPDTLVFFAADVTQARQIRPYLPNSLAIYATSLLFTGDNETLINFDLDGIRFIDMPWLLQSDHPAVMLYPRTHPPLPIDQERLYALGIDAFRLIQVLLANQLAALPLDGVTGRIQLSEHTFQREALAALFVQGHAQPADAPVTPAVSMFPGHASTLEEAASADLPHSP